MIRSIWMYTLLLSIMSCIANQANDIEYLRKICEAKLEAAHRYKHHDANIRNLRNIINRLHHWPINPTTRKPHSYDVRYKDLAEIRAYLDKL